MSKLNPADFAKEYENPLFFINDKLLRNVTHGAIYSVANMNDQELREAIMKDVLTITMLEIQLEHPIHFGFTRLLQFVPKFFHKRVLTQFHDPEIYRLMDIQRTETGSEIRIRKDHAILQAAMDYAGVWYSGFPIPEEVTVLVVNRAKVEELGGLDNAAKMVCMDIYQTVEGVSTVQ